MVYLYLLTKNEIGTFFCVRVCFSLKSMWWIIYQ